MYLQLYKRTDHLLFAFLLKWTIPILMTQHGNNFRIIDWPVHSSHKGPAMWRFVVLIDVIRNKLLKTVQGPLIWDAMKFMWYHYNAEMFSWFTQGWMAKYTMISVNAYHKSIKIHDDQHNNVDMLSMWLAAMQPIVRTWRYGMETNRLLNKQSNFRWSETPWRSCDNIEMNLLTMRK